IDTGGRPEPTLVGYGHDGAIDRSRRHAPAANGGLSPDRGPATATATESVTAGPAGPPAASREPATATESVTAGAAAPPVAIRGPARRGPLARPPVRLLARGLGVDRASLAPGSGPGGIVTRADVEAAAAARAATPAGT